MIEHNSELEQLQRTGQAIITNVRITCEQRQLETRKREKGFEEGNFNKSDRIGS